MYFSVCLSPRLFRFIGTRFETTPQPHPHPLPHPPFHHLHLLPLPLENVQCICAALHKFSVEICIKSTLTRAIRKQATSFPTDRLLLHGVFSSGLTAQLGLPPPPSGVGRADLEICYKLVQRTNVAILSTHVCSRLFVVSALSLLPLLLLLPRRRNRLKVDRAVMHIYSFD